MCSLSLVLNGGFDVSPTFFFFQVKFTPVLESQSDLRWTKFAMRLITHQKLNYVSGFQDLGYTHTQILYQFVREILFYFFLSYTFVVLYVHQAMIKKTKFNNRKMTIWIFLDWKLSFCLLEILELLDQNIRWVRKQTEPEKYYR